MLIGGDYEGHPSYIGWKCVCKFKLYDIDIDIYQSLEANSLDLDEVAHYEPPYQGLRCLQIE